jgi:prepilin-type N-terminal cleavage/methylation domain-containing protein
MGHDRARSGFTIVELAVVLAIVALIAGLAAPRYAAAADRYRMKAAAYRLAKDMEMARTAARCESLSINVAYTTGAGGGYQITHMTPAFGTDPYTVDLSVDPYNVILTDADFGGFTTVKYDAFGVGPAGDVTLQSTRMVAKVHIPDQPGPATVAITGK